MTRFGILKSLEKILRGFDPVDSSDMRIGAEEDLCQSMATAKSRFIRINSIGERIFIQPKNVHGRIGGLEAFEKIP